MIGLCGSLGEGAEQLLHFGITKLIALSDFAESIEDAIANAERCYFETAVRMFREEALTRRFDRFAAATNKKGYNRMKCIG